MTDQTIPRAGQQTDPKAVVGAYLATWNATNAEERRRLLADHWSAEATYVDPLADVSGHAGVDAVIDGVHGQFPGFVFATVGEVDGHHRQARFQWGLGPVGDEPMVIGFDVVTWDDEGRIETVHGFLDRVPA